MNLPFEQGDILSVERIKRPVLIVSKNYFNQSEQAIVCPILPEVNPDPLCEQMKLVDLTYRGYKKIARLKYPDIINIADAVQSIFDY